MQRAGISASSLLALAAGLTACSGPNRIDHGKTLADAPVVATIPMAARPDVPPPDNKTFGKVPSGYRLVVKDGVETFCSTEPVTGSRMETFERCFTRAQYEAFRQNAEQFVRRQQSGVGEQVRPGANGPSSSPQPTAVSPPPY